MYSPLIRDYITYWLIPIHLTTICHHTVIRTLLTIYSVLLFTSPSSFCNYRLVLINLLPFSLILLLPFPVGNWQNVLCIYESVSGLLVCLFCFIDSIINMYLLPFYFSNFLFLLPLFLKKDPLIFHIILIWWWWTPLAFSCLQSSLSVLLF